MASAIFAASLAWAPNPYVIAGLWILSGTAWAAVIPVQQAVIVGPTDILCGVGRVWTFVIAVDIAWTLWKVYAAPRISPPGAS